MIKLKYFLRSVVLQLIVKINNYHKPASPAPHDAQIGGKLALAPRKPSTTTQIRFKATTAWFRRVSQNRLRNHHIMNASQ